MFWCLIIAIDQLFSLLPSCVSNQLIVISDYVANRLYWIDAKRHTIESSNMLGLERVSILKSHLHLNHPFAITVFEVSFTELCL